MPKITIYVSDDLKARMDSVESLEPNWSALAQESFLFEVQRLQTRKEGASRMDAVIERLRVSKQKKENADKSLGYAHGRKWAMERAEYDQLERLDARQDMPYSPDVDGQHGWFTAAAILADDELSQRDCREYWESWVGEEAPSDEFVDAFVEGATDVFSEVNAKL